MREEEKEEVEKEEAEEGEGDDSGECCGPLAATNLLSFLTRLKKPWRREWMVVVMVR